MNILALQLVSSIARSEICLGSFVIVIVLVVGFASNDRPGFGRVQWKVLRIDAAGVLLFRRNTYGYGIRSVVPATAVRRTK